jgi:hypothetical protein
MKFKYLYENSGYQSLKINSYIFICIISFIIGILLISKSNALERDNTTPLLQKIIKVFRNMFLFTSLGSFLFYIYLYVVNYLPEYYQWLESIDPNLRNVIIANTVLNNMNNY